MYKHLNDNDPHQIFTFISKIKEKNLFWKIFCWSLEEGKNISHMTSEVYLSESCKEVLSMEAKEEKCKKTSFAVINFLRD